MKPGNLPKLLQLDIVKVNVDKIEKNVFQISVVSRYFGNANLISIYLDAIGDDTHLIVVPKKMEVNGNMVVLDYRNFLDFTDYCVILFDFCKVYYIELIMDF